MQKRIYLTALVIGAILSVHSVEGQSSEQKLRQQIQAKRQDVADMQQKLATQRQQRLIERIPPPPITHNTVAQNSSATGEPPLNKHSQTPAGAGNAAANNELKPTKKQADRKE